MFYSIHDFIETWKIESESTLKVYFNLTDKSLLQPIYGEGRTLGRLANHLIGAITTIPSQAGLPVNPESPSYTTAAELITGYQQASKNLVDVIQKNWTDNSLLDEVKMYRRFQWKKGLVLLFLILHQTHHRGQITVLMRQAGLPVPGLYGPSKEEWEAMNMPVMP